jgi:hypothetical protein
MQLSRLTGAAALCAAILQLPGCGGSATGEMPAATVAPLQAQLLDTQQLIAMAENRSETSDPLPVGNGALMLADLDDQTSDPVPVG